MEPCEGGVRIGLGARAVRTCGITSVGVCGGTEVDLRRGAGRYSPLIQEGQRGLALLPGVMRRLPLDWWAASSGLKG